MRALSRLTRSTEYRWIVAAMAFFAVFGAIGLGRFGYAAILPSMQEALSLSGAASGSLASWNFAGYTVMAVVGGVLASRLGPRLVVTVGLFAAAAGMLLTGLSGELATASAARLLTGMGSGIVLPPSIALMAAWFHARRLGVASGIVPAGSSLAVVFVGPIVPRIIAGGGPDGWRLAWYSFAAVTAFACALNLIVMRNRPYETKKPPRLQGSAPLGLVALVRSRHIWHLGFIYFVYGMAFQIYFTFFQKRLTTDLSYSTETAGSLFLILGAAGVVAGVLWGAISDHMGRGRTMVIVFVILAAAAAVFALWPATVSLAVSGFMVGLAGLSMPSLMGAACGDEFGPSLAPASLGIVTVFIGAGQGIGPYVGGLMEDLFSSLGPSYLLSAAIFVIGAVAAAFLPDARRRRSENRALD